MIEKTVVLRELDDRALVADAAGLTLAKLYLSADRRKLRVVLPGLKNFAQVKIDVDHGLLDFERDAAEAQRGIRR